MLNDQRHKFPVKVEIKVDSKEISSSNFVQRLTANIMEGLLLSLKNVPESYRQITITIHRMNEEQDIR